jgi:hypothetical protein
MTTETPSSPQRTPSGIAIAATIGFGIVSVLSCVAGYSVSPGTSSNEHVPYAIFALFLVILPYFLLRETVLESPTTVSHDAVQVVHWFAALFWIFGIVVLWVNRSSFSSVPHAEFAAVMAFSTSPFAYLYLRVVSLFNQGKLVDGVKTFPKRVLLPALFTCVMPFVFGWSISNPSAHIWLVFSTAAGLIAWELLTKVSTRLADTLIALVLVLSAAFILQAAFIPDYRSLIFGCLMTLAMGSTEVAKRVHMTYSSKISVHPDEKHTYYLAGSNWALVVFPLTLLVLPLLVIDFPTWPIFVISALLIAHWTRASEQYKRSRQAYGISIMLGYLVPCLIVIGGQWPVRQSILQVDLVSDFFTYISILCTIVLGKRRTSPRKARV